MERNVSSGGDRAPSPGNPAAAEDALQQCQRVLGEVQQIARIGSWRYQIPDGRVWWSEELYRIFGLPPGDAPHSPETVFALIHPDDRATFAAQVSSREPHRSDYRIVLPDGSVKHIHEEVRVERDAQGRPVCMYGTAQDVTERARSEENLREQRSWLDAIVAVTSDWIWEVNADARYTQVGEQVRDLLGYEPQELIGKSPFELMPPAEAERVAGVFGEIARARRPFSGLVNANRHRDGRLVYLETSGVPVVDENGAFRGYRGIDRDITERKRAEEELAGQRAMLQQILDTSSVAIFLVDRAGRITHANRCMAEMFGRATERELLGCAYAELVHPAERETGRATMLALLAGEIAAVDLERRYLRRDGTEFWGHLTGRRFHDAHGAQLGLVGVVSDVTERKQAEQALRKSEKMLQAIIDAEPECVKLLDAEARLLFMNQAGLDMLQADSLDQVRGQCVCPLVTSAYRQAFLDLTQRVFRGESGILLFEMVGAKGRRLWLETHAVPLHDEGGAIVALLGVTRDVTERKRVEESLRASETRFRSIIESSPVGILAADLESRRFLYANPEICRLLGYSERDFATLTAADLAVPEERLESAAGFQNHADGRLRATERTFRRKDGSPVRVAISSVTMEFDGRPCLVGFFTDVTERLLLEEERLRAQKLESVGTLAGGIAHDFNNLLQGVFGSIAMAKLALDRPEKALAILEQAEKALHLSVNLTTQLLTFSKGGKPVRRTIDVRPVIEDAVRLALSGSRVTHGLAFDERLSAVDADEGQIGQVVQNLVLNAEQAMPLGGRIEISARNAAPERVAELGLPAGAGFVEIAVRDEGIGIPPAHLPRIFDPYFTTKEKGSGLGLATSYSIVRNHDGTIQARSELGKGSTFTVYLPASAAATERPAALEERRACARSRVLVMDDEEIVRAVAGELLQALGHDAELAADGAEAVALFTAARAAGRPFDVVILDLTIRGGMGGEETARRLREIDPAVRTVVSSGYSDDGVVATFRRHGFRSFLKKPYSLAELARVLAEALQETT